MLASIQHNRKRILIIATILLSLFLVAFFIPDIASAQTNAPQDFGVNQFEQNTALGSVDIRVVIARIIRVFLGLLGIIAVSIMVYAGYVWMTSGGSEERIAFARKTMINATIGLAIILAAFSIVQFILNALANATTYNPKIDPDAPPPFNSFAGSGGLGHIIQDHYPFRDQENVARNTKIVITFREPIDPASIIENEEPIGDAFGVCREDDSFDWAEDCDRLAKSSVAIYRADDPEQLAIEAAVTIAYEGTGEDANAKIFVFRPLEFLGDDIEDVEYKVQLTDNILKKNGDEAFDKWPPYDWRFFTGTEFDFSPPFVEETAPAEGSAIYRNNVLQITFNEPVDPTVVQGTIDDTGSFTNAIFGTPEGVTPTGQWMVSNGYRTVEFISDQPCGKNSCGDTMYCLPADDSACDDEGFCPDTSYNVLVRTAATIGATWESIPFTGVADMAGNALDSEPLGVRNGKPTVGVPPTTIGPGELVPDNFHLPFQVKNEIDYSIPHIQQIFPEVDQEDIVGDVPLIMSFSHIMWLATLEGIDLVEHGTIPEGESLADIWNVKRSKIVGSGANKKTQTELLHRVFGPNNLPLFYFTAVPGTVKASNQNCLYPGRGPSPIDTVDVPDADGKSCNYVIADDGSATSIGCIPVDGTDNNADTGCAHNGSNILQGTVAECLEELESVSVSSVE